METSRAIVKMENEKIIKTEPCQPNTESPAIFDGNIKLELKTEPDIVEIDTSIFAQDFQDNNFGDYSSNDNQISFDLNADIDESIDDGAIVKEEPVFYDPCVGEIVPSSQLAELLESSTAIKCSKKSNSVQTFAKNQSKPFKCQQCSAAFNQHFMLKQHIKIHKQMAKAELFVCTYCCRRFSNRRRLSSHERVHRGEKPFECLICHKRFNAKVSLDTHESIHNGKKPFQCDECKLKFRTKQHLEKHTKIHTKKVGNQMQYSRNNRAMIEPIPEHLLGLKLFECYLCTERFQFNRSYLKLHFQSKHIGGNVYECDYCSKKFLQKKNIEQHMRRVHMRTHLFKCNECEKQFRSDSDLKLHSKQHNSDSQKFQCDFCPMQLSTKKILNIHRKTHTALKPYECEYCEKKFLKPGCLKRHTMTHTGERPFGCNICLQKFSRNHLLTEHKRNVHKICKTY